MLEIDQIAGVRAEEVPVGELGFHVFECAVDRVFAVKRVDDDGVPDRLEIKDVREIHPHLPLAGFDEHGIVAVAAHHVDRFLELLRKREPWQRFEQVGQGAHFVAADGVLRGRGDEDDHDVVVAFADAAGGGHAVHLLHFNIEQQNVVNGGIFLHDARAVVEYGDGELLAGLALVAIEVIEYQLAACRVVLDDSDSDIAHDEPPRLTVQTTVHSLAE